MADIDIQFGTEPPGKAERAPSEMQQICAALREHTGEWALIRKDANATRLGSYASNLKSGVHKGNAKNEFEATVGVLPDELQTEPGVVLHGVWARHVGVPERVDVDPAPALEPAPEQF